MKKFAIKENQVDKVIALLTYYEGERKYEINILSDTTIQEVPIMFALFMEKGIRNISHEWSMKWVQSRVVPSSRQNIGEILRVNAMKEYDEYQLLIKNQGRSCQDEFYIEVSF